MHEIMGICLDQPCLDLGYGIKNERIMNKFMFSLAGSQQRHILSILSVNHEVDKY